MLIKKHHAQKYISCFKIRGKRHCLIRKGRNTENEACPFRKGIRTESYLLSSQENKSYKNSDL